MSRRTLVLLGAAVVIAVIASVGFLLFVVFRRTAPPGPGLDACTALFKKVNPCFPEDQELDVITCARLHAQVSIRKPFRAEQMLREMQSCEAETQCSRLRECSMSLLDAAVREGLN
jgi:hypothetical protein